MGEKDFFPKSLKNIVLSKDIGVHGKLLDIVKNKPEETAGRILSGLVLAYEDLNTKARSTICDILSFKGSSKELDEKIKKLNDSIKDKTRVKAKAKAKAENKTEAEAKAEAEVEAKDITLALLLARLDTLDKVNIENTQEKYYGLIKDTVECTGSYLEGMYKENTNVWKEMQNFSKYRAVGQYIDATFRGIVNPSMDFVNTIVDIHMKNNEGKFPEINTFGNAQSVLVRSGNTNAISILKKDEDFKNIYNFSSNNSSLENKKKETLSSDIFEGNVTSSGLARGNLNQMAEMLRSFMISNFSIVDKIEGIYEDTDKFNEFFFETIDKFNKELMENKDNSEIIKDVNYMLNCPVHISGTGENLKTTTIADCVNFIMSSDKVNFISKEQRNILEKFADNTSIRKEKSKLTIPNLKIMSRKEILEKNQDQKQQYKVEDIITIKGYKDKDDDFFKDLVLREKQQIETNDVDNDKNTLTKEEKRMISSNLHGFLNNLIEDKNSDKLLLTLQHYKNVFGDVRPMLKKFEKENKLGEDKKNFLAEVRKNYIDSKNPQKNRFEKLKVEKSHTNNIGIV